jgi:hypothetical protein
MAAGESRDQAGPLERILDNPQLARVVPHLQPELLHRIIERYGLEDCAELVALATPAQLVRIFDQDLWRAAPGRDEHFDPARFGVWIEVLLELGAAAAAEKLAEMDARLVTAGLAQYARVFDNASVSHYMTTDGEEAVPLPAIEDVPASEVGGYRLIPRRGDGWDAIVEILTSLEAERPDYFHRVMAGCRAVSSSTPEIDGLDHLFLDADQMMFDLASGRDRRREAQGYMTPHQARAFLQMSRELRLDVETVPPLNAVAAAYFRALDEATAESIEPPESGADAPAPGNEKDDSPETAAAVANVIEILQGAGIVQQPRALLGGARSEAPRPGLIQAYLQDLLAHDPAASARRNEELAYLSNTIVAGCSIQARAFTPREASDAAVGVCNLGLENWPRQWPSRARTWGPASAGRNSLAGPNPVSAGPSLIIVFQVGWKVLYDQVAMHAADRLIKVLAELRCRDRDVQAGLSALRMEMTKEWQAGTPWRARDALDVLTALDLPAWAALLGLIDECPVIHAALSASIASGRARTGAISPTDFQFISENSQIASVREFMQSLPDILRG